MTSRLQAGRTSNPRNHVFDVFRGVSATLVVVGHSKIVTDRPSDFHHAAVIVDAFFLISGLLLCQQYDNAFARGAKSLDLLVKRLIRIYPVYIAAMAVGLGLFAIETRHALDVGSLVSQTSTALFVLPAPPVNGESALFPCNPPLWSLLWEVWLNVLFVLGWRWLRGRFLLAVIAVSGAGVIAGVVLHGGIDFGFQWRMLFGGLARATFAFFSGVLLSRLHQRSTWRPQASGIVILPIFFALIFVPTPRAMSAVFELGVLFVATPVLVWFSAEATMPKPMTTACVAVGDLYYGIYAWHIPVLRAVRHVMDTQHVAPSTALLVLACVLTSAWAFAFNRIDARIRTRLLDRWRAFRRASHHGAVTVG